MAIKDTRLRFQGFPGLRQVEQVPEGVRHCVKNHQTRIYACPQQSAMKVDRATEAVIASRRHAKSRWESFQVRIYRRKHWILAVVISDIGDHAKAFQRFDHGAEVFEAAGA